MAGDIVVDLETGAGEAQEALRQLARHAAAARQALGRELGGMAQAFGRLASESGAAAGKVGKDWQQAAKAGGGAIGGLAGAALDAGRRLAAAVARLLGFGAALESGGAAAEGYGESLKRLSRAARAARGQLAGFDRLDVLGGGGGASVTLRVEAGELADATEGLAGLLAAAERTADYMRTWFAPAIAAWGDALTVVGGQLEATAAECRDAFGRLQAEALAPLWRFVTTRFVPDIVNAFSETFAPVLRDVAVAAIAEFGQDFVWVCELAGRAVRELLLPALEGVRGGVLDMLAGVRGAWEAHGAELLETFAALKQKLRGLMMSLYDGVLRPVLTLAGEALGRLWAEHLKPLWDRLALFIGELALALLHFWNGVLLPLLGWLADTFGPVFVEVFRVAVEVAGRILGGMADLAGGLLDSLRGVLLFLTGVFTGDWERAWRGVQMIFEGVWNGLGGFVRGAVNGMIGLMNGLIRGIVTGVNAAVAAMNTIRFSVPDWVPVLGGRAWGFSMPTITAPQIPYLAQGAVIPPNRAFLAVLGDQRSGTNLEAPEALLRQIFREELGGLETGGGDVNIRFTGSLSQLARVLKPEIERETRRTGGALVAGNRL